MVKLAVRNLRASTSRLTLTVLAVVLGVAFVAGTMVLTTGVSRSFDESDPTPGEDADVVVRAEDQFSAQTTADGGRRSQPIEDGVIGQVRDIAGVRRAYGAVIGDVAVIGRDGTLVSAQGGQAQLGISWSELAGSTPAFVAGRPPQRPDEVALDEHTARRAGYSVDDRVTLVIRGAVRSARLVGVFEAGSLTGTTLVGFEPATAQRLLESPASWSYIAVEAREDVTERGLRDRMRDVLPEGYEVITGEEHAEELASGAQRFLLSIRVFLYTFAAVAIVVGGFIIFNTFSILLAQRTRGLALLRAVGVSQRQVTALMMAEAAGIGIVGATLGLIAGLLVAVLLRMLLRSAGMDVSATPVTLSPSAVLLAYAVGVVSTAAATYIPARRAARVSPVAALRGDATATSGPVGRRRVVGYMLGVIGFVVALASALASVPPAVTLVGVLIVFCSVVTLAPLLSRPILGALTGGFPTLFGSVGRLAKDNAQRNPRRSAATALALMIGLALVSAVTVLNASAITSIDRAVNRALGADYMVISRTSGISPEVERALDDVAEVASATAAGYGRVELGGQVADVVSGDPEGLARAAKLSLLSGDLHTGGNTGGNGILVDRGTAESRGWTVGTTVPAMFADGERGELRVVGIYRDNQLLGPYLLGPGVYEEHFVDQLAGFIYVDAHSPGPQAKRSIARTLSAWPQLTVLDQEEIREQNRQSVSQFVAFIIALLVLSIVIAALGITNTLALSVVERSHEVGVLRALGMSRRQLRQTIRLEAIAVALFGALLGLGLGVMLGAALQRVMATRGITVLVVPVGQLAGYIVLAVIIAVLAAEWPARRAARMDVLRAINAL